MAITIQIEKVTQLIPRTVETPFYYKYDLGLDHCDSVIYGKITDDCVVSVQATFNNSELEIEYEVTKILHPNFNDYKPYLSEQKYASTKEEFDKAVADMNNFIKKEAV